MPLESPSPPNDCTPPFSLTGPAAVCGLFFHPPSPPLSSLLLTAAVPLSLFQDCRRCSQSPPHFPSHRAEFDFSPDHSIFQYFLLTTYFPPPSNMLTSCFAYSFVQNTFSVTLLTLYLSLFILRSGWPHPPPPPSTRIGFVTLESRDKNGLYFPPPIDPSPLPADFLVSRLRQ